MDGTSGNMGGDRAMDGRNDMFEDKDNHVPQVESVVNHVHVHVHEQLPVPMAHTLQKHNHVLQVESVSNHVHVPVHKHLQVPIVHTSQKHSHVPQVETVINLVHVPVHEQLQVPMVHTSRKLYPVPQVVNHAHASQEHIRVPLATHVDNQDMQQRIDGVVEAGKDLDALIK